MTSIEIHNAQRQMRNQFLNAVARVVMRAVQAAATWRKRRRDRAAFMQLVGKEDWIYRDIGISRGDVEWAARLPKRLNAAKELERLRAGSLLGR